MLAKPGLTTWTYDWWVRRWPEWRKQVLGQVEAWEDDIAMGRWSEVGQGRRARELGGQLSRLRSMLLRMQGRGRVERRQWEDWLRGADGGWECTRRGVGGEEVAGEAAGFTVGAAPARRVGGVRRRSATRVRGTQEWARAPGWRTGWNCEGEPPGGGKRRPPDGLQGVNYFDVLMGRASKPRRAVAKDAVQADVSLEAGVS